MSENMEDDEYLNSLGLSGKNYKKIELPCEICERDDFETILTKGKIGRPGEYGPVNIRQCRHCGHVMMNPRYEPQFYKDFYASVYSTVVANFGGAEPEWTFLERHVARGRRVCDYLRDNHGLTDGEMLDLGCSYGAMLIPFKEQGWGVSGIDPEISCIEYGQKELNLPVDYGFGEELPYADASKDLVISLGALEHVHDFHATMMEMNRVIRPGGYLFIRMRHNRPWGLIWEYFNKNHYRFFSGATHKLAVMRYGFDVVEYTDTQVEDRTGDRYLLCKNVSNPSLVRMEQAIQSGLRDSPTKLKAYLSDHHEKFLNRCRDLIALESELRGNIDKMLKAIEDGRLEMTLLFGDRKESLQRALLEAHRVIEEDKKPGFLPDKET